MTFDPISLTMRAVGGGWKIIKGAAQWASRPFERLMALVAAVMLCAHWFIIDPRLRSEIETLQARVDAEVEAHRQTKDNYRKAMLHAEEKARAAVEAEMERQSKNDTIAIDQFRAGTGDLDLRADRLRNHFGGAAVGGPASGANLPATVAHSTGAAQAGPNSRLSGSAGIAGAGAGASRDLTCPAQLMASGISMSIEERRVATEQAQQLDAILKLDALNAGEIVEGVPHE